MENLEKFGINNNDNSPEEIAVYSLAFCYSLVERQIEDYLKQFNISPAKFNTLLIIKHQGKDEGISQIDIGKRLIVTASNMTKLLDRLSKEGLIERHAQEGDRRVNLIKITKKGADILDKAWPGYVETVNKITGLLSKQELKQLSGTLLKWFEKLEAIKE